MQVRHARQDDFSAIQTLLNQLMPGEPHGRRAMWKALEHHPAYAAWVADVDGVLAGFIDVFVFPDVAHGAPISVINNLVVGEPFRRRGLATRLLQAAVDHSRQAQAVEVHVWTDFSNERAIRLYKQVGFVERSLLLELETAARKEHNPA